jgi:hypothetical protein
MGGGTCLRSIYPKDYQHWNVTHVLYFACHVSLPMHAHRFHVNLFGVAYVLLGVVESDAAS